MVIEQDFYKKKKLKDLSQEEWEALCDCCGQCCYRKYVEGRGKKQKLYFTRICCNLLDVHTGLCSDYENRFKKNKECTLLSIKTIREFSWLPETCSYRLLAEGKPLPNWHPLITGIPVKENPEAQKLFIQDGIHEKDVEHWEDYIL